MISAIQRLAVIFRLSGGHAYDAPEGRRALPESWVKPVARVHLAMDRPYEGDDSRRPVEKMGMMPVVPTKVNRKVGRDYDREC